VEELRGRLARKGFGAAEISNCLSWLQERELLDDTAFASALVRDRLALSPRGAAFLIQELSRRGISPSVAQAAVEDVFQQEEASEGSLAEAAGASWARKQGQGALQALTEGSPSPSRAKARRRLYAFLARRGFRGEAISRGLEAGMNEAHNILSNKK
jgi:SOS response regulatory protein OraA/RecX